MDRNINMEFGIEDDNIDFDSIRKEYGHLTAEELDKEFEDFKKELLARWAKESK